MRNEILWPVGALAAEQRIATEHNAKPRLLRTMCRDRRVSCVVFCVFVFDQRSTVDCFAIKTHMDWSWELDVRFVCFMLVSRCSAFAAASAAPFRGCCLLSWLSWLFGCDERKEIIRGGGGGGTRERCRVRSVTLNGLTQLWHRLVFWWHHPFYTSTTIFLWMSVLPTTEQNSSNEILPSSSLSANTIVLSTICCSCVSFRLLPTIIFSTFMRFA